MKCLICIDKLVQEGQDDPSAASEADTMAAMVQNFTIAGQQVIATVVQPVCFGCRKAMPAPASKAGLVVA